MSELLFFFFFNGALSIVYPPVSFKEVGLRHILPPYSGLDALGRHPVAKLGDVLGVSRLQHCVLKHPELLPCKSKWRGKQIKRRRTSNSLDYPPGPKHGKARFIKTDTSLVTNGRQ